METWSLIPACYVVRVWFVVFVLFVWLRQHISILHIDPCLKWRTLCFAPSCPPVLQNTYSILFNSMRLFTLQYCFSTVFRRPQLSTIISWDIQKDLLFVLNIVSVIQMLCNCFSFFVLFMKRTAYSFWCQMIMFSALQLGYCYHMVVYTQLDF